MRIQSSLLVLVLLVFSFSIMFDGISAVRSTIHEKEIFLTGDWSPIKDVKDPHIVEIGQFAVKEYNEKTKTGLKFDQVISGESQVVSGINYKLVLKAKEGSSENNYEAIVWEKVWMGFRNLTSFRRV
ncbi:Proteinase inhibitor I25 [Macleaya cordata]|uniref:Proteinase inhibitor I25 n=1 Tax=Macleaya cordata TaxID=56857 RepID=A0A200RBH6_MACCD|nr:Proteinase inhibitor I25 [Macleaya cordata]